MIRSYWNALRVGDAVVVHDDADRGFLSSNGTVAFVESRKPTHGIGVRITDDHGTSRLVRPKRLAVHLRSGDAHEDCWRCGLRQGPRSA